MATPAGSGLSPGPSASPARGPVPPFPRLDRISLELTNACAKACPFCYNHSQPDGATEWTPTDVVELATDCAQWGVQALSLGGGEPLQYPGLFEVLGRLDGVLFRSFTTNGLLLDGHLERVVASRPDKVHVSLHFPDSPREVARVARQVVQLNERGVRSGVNLLVRRSGLGPARDATATLNDAGIGVDRIVFLPMRGSETPTPRELATVAGTPRFQSMTCLMGCAASPRFASLDWAKRAAWCSYTTSRRRLLSHDYAGLVSALTGLDLVTC
ncbi:MAG: radical SAM protein [Acidobacteriota bacterium]